MEEDIVADLKIVHVLSEDMMLGGISFFNNSIDNPVENRL
jgi:hypothetical protein